jgi:hypothetical protein
MDAVKTYQWRMAVVKLIIARHFALSEEIKSVYRQRNSDPRSPQLAINPCQQLIAFAPRPIAALHESHQVLGDYGRKTRIKALEREPFQLNRHFGFEQLAIIREKQGDFAETIRIAREAKANGWAGDCDARIAKCERKQYGTRILDGGSSSGVSPDEWASCIRQLAQHRSRPVRAIT